MKKHGKSSHFCSFLPRRIRYNRFNIYRTHREKRGCRRVSLEERKRNTNEAEAKKEKGFGCHLDQKVLSLCCEHNEDDKIVRYVENGMEYLDKHGEVG